MSAPIFAHGKSGTLRGSKGSFELHLWCVVQVVQDEMMHSIYDDMPGQYRTFLACLLYYSMPKCEPWISLSISGYITVFGIIIFSPLKRTPSLKDIWSQNVQNCKHYGGTFNLSSGHPSVQSCMKCCKTGSE